MNSTTFTPELNTHKQVLRSVMLYANKLWEQPNWFKTWSETLKEAWSFIKDKIKEYKMLTIGHKVSLKDLNILLIKNENPIEFGYYKKDGSFRIFKGTKNFELIPSEHVPTSESKATNLRFFDFNAQGWRGLAGNTECVYML